MDSALGSMRNQATSRRSRMTAHTTETEDQNTMRGWCSRRGCRSMYVGTRKRLTSSRNVKVWKGSPKR